MPSSPCVEPSCGSLAVYRGRCAVHSKDRERETHRTGRLTPTSGRIYGQKRWILLRRRQLFDEPLCRECAKEGRETIATLVDHIVPVEDGGEPWSLDNLQSLCAPHHGVKTSREVHARSR